MMDAVDVDQKLLDGYRQRFRKITDGDIETQLEFFLKRYILVLGDSWKEVTTLANEFHRYCDSRNGVDLNIIEAADFLQKNGKTRTAAERKAELSDIDLDDNKRICFLEYCLLHFKTMVLTDYFKMRKMIMPKDIDLSKDGVGVTGVGDFILDTLFRFGAEVDPEIEAAIDKVMAERKHREKVMEELQQTANDIKNNQVVRMKAVHELARMEREDTSGPEVELITLLAARRRAQKNGGKNAKVLDEEKKNEEKAKQEKLKQSKQKLGNLKNVFQSNAKVDSTKFVNRAADRASIRAIQSKGLNLNGQGARKDY